MCSSSVNDENLNYLLLIKIRSVCISKVISDIFQAICKGPDPRNGIWNDPVLFLVKLSLVLANGSIQLKIPRMKHMLIR